MAGPCYATPVKAERLQCHPTMQSLGDPLLLSHLGEPMLRGSGSRWKDVTDFWSRLRLLSVASFCVLMGIMHPLATESSKTAQVIVCSETAAGLHCTAEGSPLARMSMPFHGVTLNLAAELLAVLSAFVVVSCGEGSVKRGLKRLLMRPEAWLQLLPVGIAFGLGDLLQTAACNAASAPVVLVVGQSKLLLTALLSKMLLADKNSKNWLRLLTISCAAAASTDISADGVTVARSIELYGALLALAKAVLSATGAVLSESLYKSGDESFWVVSFRVQLLMLATNLMLLPMTSGDLRVLSPGEFFYGGPLRPCEHLAGSSSCVVEQGFDHCTCTDRSGWDFMTLLAVFAIVLNGYTTGLMLKHLSAISKAVCNAMSPGALYMLYILLGFRPFSWAQANLLSIIIIASVEYALERAALQRDLAGSSGSISRGKMKDRDACA